MNKYIVKVVTAVAAVLFLSVTILESTAEARAGGSRSSGSRGSRSYSKQASPSYQPAPSRQQTAPVPGAVQQPAGGGFMRSMAGGLAGGMLGSMLFSSFAGAGGGVGSVGGGISMFEIILLAGGVYLIYRYIKNKRTESAITPFDRR